ncbi:MAG: Tim44/TimA family putative adaptor protein [Alphaproteobacteria bacterium]|nr:Tim44/TimA family putative adaptor protein [Alphaproteobacteria bacterium]
MQVDIDILVYAVIAALLLGRFWAILGTRSDNDPQRLNPFAPPRPSVPENDAAAQKQGVLARLLPPAPPPHSLAGGLAQVKTAIPSFEEKPFLQESRDIFASVVGAYASGRLTLVNDFLSPGLMGNFQQSVNARLAAGQTAETRISRIKEAEVIAARVEGKNAYITVRFVSEQQNLLRDNQNAIIGGAEGQYEEVTDIWTFARDTQASSPKWAVVETRS